MCEKRQPQGILGGDTLARRVKHVHVLSEENNAVGANNVNK